MTMQTPNLSALSAKAPDRIFMFTVGGCGEFGMNLTVYAYRGKTYVVDCGLAFAEAFEIGVDAHIPSPELLLPILGGLPTAFLITHGHEDHLGALPFFLEEWKVPVYIGPWAKELLKDKLLQRGDSSTYDIHEVKAGDRTSLGDVTIDWIHVPHSIPHCSSLLIKAGSLRVLHTGDFKTRGYLPFDQNLDESILQKISREGPVLALVADSTNAGATGYCPSESVVVPELAKLIASAPGVTFVTTFSSNLWRLKTLLLIAQEQGKRVFVLGTGMRKSIELGVKFKLLSNEVTALVDESGLKHLSREQLLVICSGCQGEYRSGLRRLVNDEVSFLKIAPNDQVIFSSRVIPGNEKSLAKVVSICHLKGAKVITTREKPEIHVSGHAYADDIGIFLRNLKPQFHIPVHGTFTQLKANQGLVKAGESLNVTNGTILSLGSESADVIAQVELQRLFVDSWSRCSMSYETMRERHKIGDSGLAFATGAIGPKKTHVEIEFIGIPFRDDNEKDRFQELLLGRLQKLFERYEQQELPLSGVLFNEDARLIIRRALTDRFVKKPVVISKIFLASEF